MAKSKPHVQNKVITLKVTPELNSQINIAATQNDRSKSNWIKQAIKEKLASEDTNSRKL